MLKHIGQILSIAQAQLGSIELGPSSQDGSIADEKLEIEDY